MTSKLAFISLPVTDLDRSVIFYRDVLGLKILLMEDGWAEFDLDGQRLALHREIINEPSHGATIYFKANSIEEEIESLKQKGVSFKGKLKIYSYGKLICFADPDGNMLGLYEPPAP